MLDYILGFFIGFTVIFTAFVFYIIFSTPGHWDSLPLHSGATPDCPTWEHELNPR